MKKTFLLGIILLLFILDWLALDDITTNPQPSYFWEYLMLISSIIIIGCMSVYSYLRSRHNTKSQIR